jgi:hypothetical protein
MSAIDLPIEESLQHFTNYALPPDGAVFEFRVFGLSCDQLGSVLDRVFQSFPTLELQLVDLSDESSALIVNRNIPHIDLANAPQVQLNNFLFLPIGSAQKLPSGRQCAISFESDVPEGRFQFAFIVYPEEWVDIESPSTRRDFGGLISLFVDCCTIGGGRGFLATNETPEPTHEVQTERGVFVWKANSPSSLSS